MVLTTVAFILFFWVISPQLVMLAWTMFMVGTSLATLA